MFDAEQHKSLDAHLEKLRAIRTSVQSLIDEQREQITALENTIFFLNGAINNLMDARKKR